MVATNLTNSKKLTKNLIADIRIEGRPLRAGDARSQISLDPYAPRPTFAFNLEVKELPLVKLNDFAKAYGGFTFEAGTLKLAMEASAKNGGYQGYVEPIFDHMGIFNPEHDADNPISFCLAGDPWRPDRNCPITRKTVSARGSRFPELLNIRSPTYSQPSSTPFATRLCKRSKENWRTRKLSCQKSSRRKNSE